LQEIEKNPDYIFYKDIPKNIIDTFVVVEVRKGDYFEDKNIKREDYISYNHYIFVKFMYYLA
jgi:hypothetical protein